MLKINPTILIKRVYLEKSEEDGQRILVDRLWPRGLSKEKASIDIWMKEISPSAVLRKWYEHDPAKWLKFKTKYFVELDNNKDNVDMLLAKSKAGTVTLLYSSKEEKLNNAVALKEYIETIILSKTV